MLCLRPSTMNVTCASLAPACRRQWQHMTTTDSFAQLNFLTELHSTYKVSTTDRNLCHWSTSSSCCLYNSCFQSALILCTVVVVSCFKLLSFFASRNSVFYSSLYFIVKLIFYTEYQETNDVIFTHHSQSPNLVYDCFRFINSYHKQYNSVEME